MWCVLNVKYNHSTSLWPVNDHSWLQSVQWLCGVMIPLSTCCCTYTAVYIRTSRGRAVAMRVQWICVAALIIRWLVAARDDRSSNDTQSPTSLTLVPIRSQLLASSLLPPSTVCLPRTAQLLCSIDWLDLTWSILLPLYMRVSVGNDVCHVTALWSEAHCTSMSVSSDRASVTDVHCDCVDDCRQENTKHLLIPQTGEFTLINSSQVNAVSAVVRSTDARPWVRTCCRTRSPVIADNHRSASASVTARLLYIIRSNALTLRAKLGEEGVTDVRHIRGGGCHMRKKLCRYLVPFEYNARMWRTDRQAWRNGNVSISVMSPYWLTAEFVVRQVTVTSSCQWLTSACACVWLADWS